MLNWAANYNLRTRGLLAGIIMGFHDGPKILHHRPTCKTCGAKTKTWHVLANRFTCKKCINNDDHDNEDKFLLV